MEESTVLHVENWIDCQAQRVGINNLVSCLWLIIVAREILGPILSNIFISDVDNDTGSIDSKFAERLKQSSS